VSVSVGPFEVLLKCLNVQKNKGIMYTRVCLLFKVWTFILLSAQKNKEKNIDLSVCLVIIVQASRSKGACCLPIRVCFEVCEPSKIKA
jgi:hypothetical protein